MEMILMLFKYAEEEVEEILEVVVLLHLVMNFLLVCCNMEDKYTSRQEM